MTCGWVNYLPVHAAGDYTQLDGAEMIPTVMDNVISSYTPTFKALMYARTKLADMNNSSSTNNAHAFLAAMSETPDHPPFAHASTEILAVEGILAPAIRCTRVQSPNLDRKIALQNLRTCVIAHLACHGVADPHDPLRSILLLQDWNSKPLRVGWLMRMEMKNCQLAYLSAC